MPWPVACELAHISGLRISRGVGGDHKGAVPPNNGLPCGTNPSTTRLRPSEVRVVLRPFGAPCRLRREVKMRGDRDVRAHLRIMLEKLIAHLRAQRSGAGAQVERKE